MLFPVQEIKRKAWWHSRNAALATLGAALLLVGGGFLVAVIWVLLAERFSPVIASAGIGVVFLLAGLIVLALRNSGPAPRIPSIDEHLRAEAERRGIKPPKAGLPLLMEAFVLGIYTYLQIRDRPR